VNNGNCRRLSSSRSSPISSNASISHSSIRTNSSSCCRGSIRSINRLLRYVCCLRKSACLRSCPHFHLTDCGDASQNDAQRAQHEHVAHIPRQPGSPPSPNVPPKGILKTVSLKAAHAPGMPSNPISAAGSNPVPAAGTPDYPMMGPLSDGRDSAPHAMAGQNEGSGGQNEGSGPIAKGMCAVCQTYVYNFQTRTKNTAGTRVHACIRTLSVRVGEGGIAGLRRHRASVSTRLRKFQTVTPLCTLCRPVRTRRVRSRDFARSRAAAARRRTISGSCFPAAAWRQPGPTTGGTGG